MSPDMNRDLRHALYDLHGCSPTITTSLATGLRILKTLSQEVGLHPLGEFAREYPGGAYSCGYFLAESHVSMHTWPERAYVAVDLFVCAAGRLFSAEECSDAFAGAHCEARMFNRGGPGGISEPDWTLSRRSADYREAYRSTERHVDLQSAHQHITIFSSPRFGRMLMLDGDVQLASSDEHVYHELLVHPALLSHPSPNEVLIIGGGDGGAIREVLKYASVRRVVLAELDEDVVRHCRRHMQLLDEQHYSDKRLTMIFGDAAEYLGLEKFDVILVDLTAPSRPSVPAYRALLERVHVSLKPGGYVSLHSGWWGAAQMQDFPTSLLRTFRRHLVFNQWIDSFVCFWSFVIAWDHEASEQDVISSLSLRSAPATRWFNTSAYSERAFRPCR